MSRVSPNRRRTGLVFTALLLLVAALAVSLPSPGFAQIPDETPELKVRTNRDAHRAMTVTWRVVSLADVQQHYQVQYRAVGDPDWLDHDLTAAGALTENRYRGVYTVIDGLYAATTYEIRWRTDAGSWITLDEDDRVTTEARANSPARIKWVASNFRVDENAEPGALVQSGWLGYTAQIYGHTGRDSDYSQNEMTYALENIAGETPGASKFAVQQWGFMGQDAYITTTESLDYEAASSYTLRLTLSDGRDANGAKDLSVDDSREITIHVNDVAVEEPVEPPGGDTTPPGDDTPPGDPIDPPGDDPTPPGDDPVDPDPIDPPPTPTERPGRVANLQSTGGVGSLTVTWDPPDDGGRAESYEVRYRPKGSDRNWTTFYQGTDTSVEITGLTGGQMYLVRVFAVNELGISRSETVRDTPQ